MRLRPSGQAGHYMGKTMKKLAIVAILAALLSTSVGCSSNTAKGAGIGALAGGAAGLGIAAISGGYLGWGALAGAGAGALVGGIVGNAQDHKAAAH